MAKASRAKGVAGEKEVADIYTEHGFEVRGLEGRGDHLAIKGPHDGVFPPLDDVLGWFVDDRYTDAQILELVRNAVDSLRSER